MRRVYRSGLPLKTRLALFREKKAVTADTDIRHKWKNFRRSARCRPVVDTLRSMAGKRGRCFYCSDSLAADIDHYLPVDVDKAHAFTWLNMLWVCPTCNRGKSATFPRDANGEPLLIDPSKINPWSRLILISDTGLVMARWQEDDSWDPVGYKTLDMMPTLNHESVTEGRIRVVKRLREVFARAAQEGDTLQVRRLLLREVKEDDYGISSWFAHYEGSSEDPFKEVLERHPPLRRRFAVMSAPH